MAVKRVIPLEVPIESADREGFSSAEESNLGLRSMKASYKATLSSKHSSLVKTARQRVLRYEKLKADFIVEMRQLAKLRHPNITTIIGAVVQAKEPLLIMEVSNKNCLS